MRRLIDAAYETAHEVLSSRRNVMEHLTRELLEREVIDAPLLQKILDQYKTGPQLKPGTFVEPSVTPLRDPEESTSQGDAAQSG